jgi:hypothetical protein
VHLPVSRTGPGPSGSPRPPRLCRGCSHPPRRPPGQAASSFTPPLRRPGGEVSHLPRTTSASWRTTLEITVPRQVDTGLLIGLPPPPAPARPPPSARAWHRPRSAHDLATTAAPGRRQAPRACTRCAPQLPQLALPAPGRPQPQTSSAPRLPARPAGPPIARPGTRQPAGLQWPGGSSGCSSPPSAWVRGSTQPQVRTLLNFPERQNRGLLIRGFGVQVPGGAPGGLHV